MSTAADKSDNSKPVPAQKSTAVLLFTIAADTTWRMFLPIIGGTVAGIWGDHTFGTKPWATIAGTAVGVVIAALLVRLQFKKAYKNDK